MKLRGQGFRVWVLWGLGFRGAVGFVRFKGLGGLGLRIIDMATLLPKTQNPPIPKVSTG